MTIIVEPTGYSRDGQHRYERRIGYSRDDDVDRRRRGPHLSAFSPADFGTNGRCRPPIYPRTPEHGTSGRHSPPFIY